MTRFLASIVLGCLPLASHAGAQLHARDDFNRAAGTNMGPDWTEMNGDLEILANQGHGVVPFGHNAMFHNTALGSYQGSVQSVTFDTGAPGLQYVALMAGLDPNTWGCVFTRLQDNNGDGLFDRLFFEAAINAGNWTGGRPVIYDLAVPTSRGRMTLSFENDGDVAVCTIENGTSGLKETARAAGILTMPFPIAGTRFGIAATGNATFDDWRIDAVTLTPDRTQISVSAGGQQRLTLQGTPTHAGLTYLILGSFSGTSPGFPLFTETLPLNVDGYFIYTLTSPNTAPLNGSLGVLDPFANASASFTLLPNSPPILVGAHIDHAAVILDLTSPEILKGISNPAGLDFVQ
ncbi:MAG: hypothetical protein H6834_15530 [Planctomycetes bacterium]|nr:hypothetical protein [Planctomycetota bacterium]